MAAVKLALASLLANQAHRQMREVELSLGVVTSSPKTSPSASFSPINVTPASV
jgi:hypothetical protein